ncbi:MAG: DUF6431 domain-containing protein [Lachnospiraceae bacterium]|nr:DUF6431 domain-containing protein [Lachnospiraceae bacterium]
MVYMMLYHEDTSKYRTTPRLLCDDPPFCPECENSPDLDNTPDARLEVKGSVRRHYKTDGGYAVWYVIPKGICPICKCNMRILPDFMAPFKHYRTDVMSAYLGGKRNSIDAKENPSDWTIDNWDRWLEINHDELSPYGIDKMRKENCSDDWIGAVVAKARNSGRKLETISGKAGKTKNKKS